MKFCMPGDRSRHDDSFSGVGDDSFAGARSDMLTSKMEAVEACALRDHHDIYGGLTILEGVGR